MPTRIWLYTLGAGVEYSENEMVLYGEYLRQAITNSLLILQSVAEKTIPIIKSEFKTPQKTENL